METITLHQVLPAVFADSRDTLESEIWLGEQTLQKGNSYLIEAVSGAGKSSFCSYLYGYRTDYSGDIRFDDRSTRTFTPRQWTQLRRNSLSCLFQELRLFPELTARENIELKNHLTRYKTEDEILRYFEMLGIGDKWNAKIARLSFGQQQRVAFIRALCQPFDFILLDEPISHLDDANSRIMADILRQECRAQSAGIIVTSIGKHPEIPYDKILRL